MKHAFSLTSSFAVEQRYCLHTRLPRLKGNSKMKSVEHPVQNVAKTFFRYMNISIRCSSGDLRNPVVCGFTVTRTVCEFSNSWDWNLVLSR